MEDDGGALPQESLSGGKADAAAAASNHSNFIFQSHRIDLLILFLIVLYPFESFYSVIISQTAQKLLIPKSADLCYNQKKA